MHRFSARRTATSGTLMLLPEGALVAHGLGVFPDAIAQAREQARLLLACGRLLA